MVLDVAVPAMERSASGISAHDNFRDSPLIRYYARHRLGVSGSPSVTTAQTAYEGQDELVTPHNQDITLQN